jgi:hypothetical protein
LLFFELRRVALFGAVLAFQRPRDLRHSAGAALHGALSGGRAVEGGEIFYEFFVSVDSERFWEASTSFDLGGRGKNFFDIWKGIG